MPELLATVTSKELAEFKAYELFNGTIGQSQYSEDALAAIHEQLQVISSLLVAQTAEDEDDIPEIIRYPRSREIRDLQLEEDDGGGAGIFDAGGT